MENGFFRIACASPHVTVADVAANVANIKELMGQCAAQGAQLVVFPELCITAYTCGDLFHNRQLLDAADDGLQNIAQESNKYPGCCFVVGLPVEYNNALYNCAAIVADGCVWGYVPKTYIPSYNEFYEKRWFQSGSDLKNCDAQCKMKPSSIFVYGGVRFGVEICEDLWVPNPPSTALALGGAEVILNISASNDLIGKHSYLMNLIAQQSARCICAYGYASAGYGESSTDLVFDAKLAIAENGRMLEQNKRWTHGNQYVIADIDIEAIRRDRLHLNSFAACAAADANKLQVVNIDNLTLDCMSNDEFCVEKESNKSNKLFRKIDPHPFVPASDERLRERCEEIVHIQSEGLCKRLDVTHCKTLVVGISGGLDSTLALLVAVRAFDTLGLDRKGIVGVTMPGFGTTGRTHSNALDLMAALGVDSREISIVPAVEQHFHDIGQDPTITDVTYENSQARERTQILMDLSNRLGGMVLGTGDLSELALGWATYNGDHMSMYGVNAGIPKTLVRHLVQYFADSTDSEAVRRPLIDIIDTPISPELIPAAADGTIAQKTEDLVGPYELHDFFLYYMLRYGFTSKRIYLLACNAFNGKYENGVIKYWLKIFYRRFFQQQFKRSCLPDGPKVGSVCLSPRGDWRMPSDASAQLWLKECEQL